MFHFGARGDPRLFSGVLRLCWRALQADLKVRLYVGGSRTT